MRWLEAIPKGLAGTFLRLSIAGVIIAAAIVARTCDASESSNLVALASAQFHDLTKAERAMLKFADADNVDRGDFAFAGPSEYPADPSNDAKNGDQWGTDRQVRAALIRWLCVAPRAIAMADAGGIHLLGARIVGSLNLSYVRLPFALALNHCSIPERIRLHSAEIPQLDLNGSYTGEIDGEGLSVHGELFLGYGFHASGEVILQDAKIDGYIDCGAGHFTHSKVEPQVWGAGLNKALNLEAVQVRSDIYLWDGFQSDGMIYLNDAVLGADLDLMGARINNQGKSALIADGIDVKGNVLIGSRSIGENSAAAASFGRISAGFQTDGLVEFTTARVGGNFVVTNAKFSGAADVAHGFVAPGIFVKGGFVWTDVVVDKGAQLNLSGSTVGTLIDDQHSWPLPGQLTIDGLTYQGIYPADVSARLRWINLQSRFYPQPYRQFAKVLRESGDDRGALEVRIAQEDARFSRYGVVGRAWGGFLKSIIGYGHQPLLAIYWSLAVILIGWLMVAIGSRAGVMRPTWPENVPSDFAPEHEELHPLLYSLDVFLPFVDLHQEHHWWPQTAATGHCVIFGRKIPVTGSALRYYLWTQIIAGWLLSAIFIAGITGLIRND